MVKLVKVLFVCPVCLELISIDLISQRQAAPRNDGKCKGCGEVFVVECKVSQIEESNF